MYIYNDFNTVLDLSNFLYTEIMSKRVKIIIAIAISFCLVLIFSSFMFLNDTPKTKPNLVSSLFPTITPVEPKTVKTVKDYIAQRPVRPGRSYSGALEQVKPNTPTPTKISNIKYTNSNIEYRIPNTPTPFPYQPIPTTAPLIVYPQSSNNSYDTIEPISAPTDRPATTHPDINLMIRGYVETTGSTMLQNPVGDTDMKAPQFTSLLTNNPYPPISHLYKVYDWNWSTNSKGNLISDPTISMFGIQANPGEPLHVLNSGYDIGGGYQVMVLYATKDSITMKYTREDNVVKGYTVHVQDIWVDPNLVSLYNQMNASGRGSLPTLRGGQIFGIASNNEVKIAMRDTGTFMDIRSKKDWWH